MLDCRKGPGAPVIQSGNYCRLAVPAQTMAVETANSRSGWDTGMLAKMSALAMVKMAESAPMASERMIKAVIVKPGFRRSVRAA